MGLPFLSSIVTVSFAHFIRNLPGTIESVGGPWGEKSSACAVKDRLGEKLT
jgi:hypothetical protein